MITFAQLGNHGRIGNSLFQAAATIALALRNNDSFMFPSWSYQQFFPGLKDHFIVGKRGLAIRSNYQEPHFAYKEIPYTPGLNIHGYLQSERYFEDHSDTIKELLYPSHPDIPDNLPIREGVASIHVRRIDYLIHKGCYVILTPENYYNAAMERIKEHGVKRFFVYSDDMEWCKNVFKGNDFYFAHNHPIVDMLSLMSCQHHIIANSSFSWWGAYLSRSVDKKIIAPKNWFGPKLAPTHPTNDLIPSAWKRI